MSVETSPATVAQTYICNQGREKDFQRCDEVRKPVLFLCNSEKGDNWIRIFYDKKWTICDGQSSYS